MKNNMKDFNIPIPEGYVIDVKNSNLAEGIIKFKEIPILNWEDYREKVNLKGKYSLLSFWEGTGNCMLELRHDIVLNTKLNENVIIVNSKEEGEALIALSKLLLIRKEYIQDWIPNYSKNTNKYCILIDNNVPYIDFVISVNHPLTFPKKELATKFMDNNIKLIEKAKILL